MAELLSRSAALQYYSALWDNLHLFLPQQKAGQQINRGNPMLTAWVCTWLPSNFYDVFGCIQNVIPFGKPQAQLKKDNDVWLFVMKAKPKCEQII